MIPFLAERSRRRLERVPCMHRTLRKSCQRPLQVPSKCHQNENGYNGLDVEPEIFPVRVPRRLPTTFITTQAGANLKAFSLSARKAKHGSPSHRASTASGGAAKSLMRTCRQSLAFTAESAGMFEEALVLTHAPLSRSRVEGIPQDLGLQQTALPQLRVSSKGQLCHQLVGISSQQNLPHGL